MTEAIRSIVTTGSLASIEDKIPSLDSLFELIDYDSAEAHHG